MRTKAKAIAPLFFLPFLAFGQGMVKRDVLELYGQVPPPPKSVQEAYSRSECTVNGDIYYCNTKKFYEPITTKIEDVGKRVEKVNASLSVPANASMANVDPQEMERKMATMSQEEKMKFAMAMMQQMNLGPKALTPESDDVQETVDEYLRQAGESAEQAMARVGQGNRLSIERDRKHKEIDDWAAAEIEKLPWVDYSEAGKFKDQKKVYAVQEKAMGKHIAVENEHLTVFHQYWNELLLSQKARYAKLRQKLAAINYGDDAKNIETKRTLIGAQQLMMGPVSELLTLSQDATNNAVNWWSQKLKLAQQMRP